ncbi:MAG: FHA domain-containing protein [Planctomycetaceae bacterium]|nr:FHA domain-containing protein [Planctomycetaceae bacterium]
MDRPAIVVGRSRRRSDIRIEDQSISAVHCEIEIGENCLQVRNRGRNGIRINGQKRDEGVLRDGDDFEIARMKYRVLMEAIQAIRTRRNYRAITTGSFVWLVSNLDRYRGLSCRSWFNEAS